MKHVRRCHPQRFYRPPQQKKWKKLLMSIDR
jgi:hypothetical protein